MLHLTALILGLTVEIFLIVMVWIAIYLTHSTTTEKLRLSDAVRISIWYSPDGR